MKPMTRSAAIFLLTASLCAIWLITFIFHFHWDWGWGDSLAWGAGIFFGVLVLANTQPGAFGGY